MSAVFNELAFRGHVLRRIAEMLFKKKKRVKLLHFSYVPDADSKDTLILRYKFANAIYFTLDGKRTLHHRFVALRPETEKKISLVVHGFFRKSSYTIIVHPDDAVIIKNV